MAKKRKDSEIQSTIWEAVVRTLLVSDLVGSTRLIEELGDEETARLFRRHDRLARDLIERYDGLEIDKTDGFFLLFKRPYDAVGYALAYHRALDEGSREMKLEVAARVGIHLGEVFLHKNPAVDVARGAKPIEVEGIAKPTAARIMSLAGSRQTLLTRGAFEIARRAAVGKPSTEGTLRWVSHGPYLVKGVTEPIEVFEAGIEGFAPLTPPPDSEKVRRLSEEKTLPVNLVDAQRPEGPPEPTRPSWRRTAVLAALLVVVLVFATWWTTRPPTLPIDGSGDVSLLLLGFAEPEDPPADTWPGPALEELFADELGRIEGLEPLPAETIEDLVLPPLSELHRKMPAAVLSEIVSVSPAQVVAVGTWQWAAVEGGDDEILFSLRLYETVGRRSVDLPETRGPPAELFARVEGQATRLAAAVRRNGAAPEVPAEVPAIEGEAAQLLEKGLAALRVLDGGRARDYLVLAAEIDGGARLDAALARALSLLGQTQDATAASRRAVETAKDLPRTERLRLRSLDLMLRRRFEPAAALVEMLDLVAGEEKVDEAVGFDRALESARIRGLAGQFREAVAALGKLRDAAGSAVVDPRLELTEAETAKVAREAKRQLEASSRARAVGEARNMPFVVARARHLEGEALIQLSSLDEAEAAFEAAREIYVGKRHQKGEADAVVYLGIIHQYRQELAEAKTCYREAASIYSILGDNRMASRMLENQAIVMQEQGDREAAIGISREATRLLLKRGDTLGAAVAQLNLIPALLQLGHFSEAREIHINATRLLESSISRHYDALALHNLAQLLFAEGRFGSAAKAVTEAIQVARRLGDSQTLHEASLLHARILAYQGNLTQAWRLSEESALFFEETGMTLQLGEARRTEGKLRLLRGELADARIALEAALQLQRESEDFTEEATTQLALAALLLHSGDPGAAEKLTSEVLKYAKTNQLVLSQAEARELLGRCLLARGRVDDAAEELALGQQLLQDQETLLYSYPFDLTAARIEIVRRTFGDTREQLQRMLAKATTAGVLVWQLEIRLVLGELELAAGDVEAGRSRLRRLAGDAETSGFGLIARRAINVLGSNPTQG